LYVAEFERAGLFEHTRKCFPVVVGYYDYCIPFSTRVPRIYLLCEGLFASCVCVDGIALLMSTSSVKSFRVDLRTFLISQSIWLIAHF
jgi:hypothetical protein